MADVPSGHSSRPATPADIEAIAAVMRASILGLAVEAYGADAATAWAEESLRRAPGLLARGSFFVAEDAGRLVAVAGWSPDKKRREIAWIRAVFVHPDRAGCGLGRRLVATAEESARAAGRAGLRVMASLNAIGFYRAIGYAELRRLCASLPPGIDLPHVLMAKGALTDRAATKAIRGRRS